jgi:predicted permease
VKAVLTRLVRLFPTAFRKQFEPDMVEQIEADYDRAASHGRLRAAAFTVATALDLVGSALAERLDSTWAEPGTSSTDKGDGMRGTMNEWLGDLRHAVRALGRSPGFTVVTVGTLGLALGANAGIFSVVDAVLLSPLPFPDSDRLVYIAASAPGSDMPDEFGVSGEFYLHYSERASLLEDVSSYVTFTSTLRADDRTERVWMSAGNTSLMQTLGATPILGRLPTPEDEDRVVLISHALWVTWFGADPDVIGRSYYVSGVDRTVIGVMGPDFWFPSDQVLLWFPYVMRAEDIEPGRFGQPLVGRLAPGADADALNAELGRLARELPERFGGSASYARLIEQHRPVVRPLEDRLLGAISGPLWVLLGSVGLLLLIACANVANLFIVRAEQRQRDLAVRRAVGAGRRQLVRSQMAEALVVAGLAGALAVLLASLTVPALLAAAPPDLPRLGEVSLGPTTLAFTFAASLLTALACGLVPAVRSSAPDLTRLRDAGRGSTRRRHWGRDGLVVAQTALALVLLIGSALLVRSFVELRRVDPGYDTEDLFTFQIAPEAEELSDGPSFARFHVDFMDRLAALPGVQSVGLIENVPLNEGLRTQRFLTADMGGNADAGPLLNLTWAAGDYWSTMGIDLLRGRVLTPDDHAGGLGNVVVSAAAAELLWPGQDPIGRTLRREDLEHWWTVVGVVEDVMQYGFREDVQPLAYFPLVGQEPNDWVLSSPAYVLKTARAEHIAPEVRALAREIAPGAPMYRVFTMAGLAADSMVQLSFTTLTLGIASVLALILGAVGLFGVLSYVVAQRTQEIGVRMALGAEAARVRRMVVGQGARVVVLGVVIGAAAAVGITRVLGSLLFGVEPVDVLTFVATSAMMLLVGMAASYLPARRASGVDPIRSLRGE